MTINDLILQLGELRREHGGHTEVYTRDVLSGVSGAVIPKAAPRVAVLAMLSGRQRKRRLFDAPGMDKEAREAGEAVVIL